MVLWQAIALAGGLSMIGAMLTWGLEPLGDNLLSALRGLWNVLLDRAPATTLGLVHVFALSAALLLSAHLVGTLLLTYYRIRRGRSRHRGMLTLLSSPSATRPATVVINHPTPVAYCLPGGARSVTVLSDGLLEMLTEEELSAVLIHEKAHLSQRHHLLLWAFAAWRAALPWLPTSQLAQQSVNELIEMLADDEALRTVPPETLIRAVAIVGTGAQPSEGGIQGVAAEGTPLLATPAEQEQLGTVRRLRRLLTPQTPLPGWERTAVLLLSGLLLAVPTALLIVPGMF